MTWRLSHPILMPAACCPQPEPVPNSDPATPAPRLDR